MINTTKGLVVGQLILYSWIDKDGDFTWDFCVVKEVFDNRFLFESPKGRQCIYDIAEMVDDKTNQLQAEAKTSAKSVATLLLKGGKPVMCRKNIFGKYMFEPKK